MSDGIARGALRAIAVAIAVLAVIDPAMTSNRSVKPVVVVAATDSIRDGALADRVAKVVGGQFTVARSPVAGASAAVLVGDRLPDASDDYPTPAFAVFPDTGAPTVSIDRVGVADAAPADARIPVMVQIRVHGASGRSLDVSLRAGNSVADHVTRRLSGKDSTLVVPLSFVPTIAGAVSLRVSAAVTGGAQATSADAAVDVRARRWTVLFYDPRPSWTSTFVRRAIEHDPRFVVTSRVVTSRNVSTDAGRPPASLGDLASLSGFDAVVIGSPEGLSAADVSGLDAYMRRRGGRVVLLLDQRVAGAYDRLASVAAWSSATMPSTALASVRPDSATLRATEVAWPAELPAGATVIAGGTRPVVWESPIGAGQLIVSGALDAWRFRDPASSGFDRFWRMLIADAANGAPQPVAVSLSSTTVAPGELVGIHAAIRDAALANVGNAANTRTVRATVSASVGGDQPVRLWPEPNVGQFGGTIRAPRAPGVYRIAVTSASTTADAPLVVALDNRRAKPSDSDLLGAWTNARGGHTLSAADIDRLPAALRAAIRPPSRVESWHPMRSAWWIVPFALALSAEWWLRRRRGLR